MNIPNRLSIVRIVLIPVFVILFFLPFPWVRFGALGVFILASVTDALDGYLARKLKMCSDVGNFLDTIADKMLVASVLISVSVALTDIGGVDTRFWLVDLTRFGAGINFDLGLLFLTVTIACSVLIICREFIISGLKMIAQSKGVTIMADKLGKIKMILQVIALGFLIPFSDFFRINDLLGTIMLSIGVLALFGATVITVISAINYMLKYRHVFSLADDKKALEQKALREEMANAEMGSEAASDIAAEETQELNSDIVLEETQEEQAQETQVENSEV